MMIEMSESWRMEKEERRRGLLVPRLAQGLIV